MTTQKTRWLLLIYRIPREPSRHRVAVWRRLKALGALYLQDGVAVLPENTVTKEQFEWLQLRIREAGGEANVWESVPNTIAEDRNLVEEFREAREAAYQALLEAAVRIERKAIFGSGGSMLKEELRKVEREYRAERKRDYFRAPLRKEAGEAIKTARKAIGGRSGEERREKGGD